MPSAYCPSCGATYDSPTISPNGPFCRWCLNRGDVVPLLSAAGRRFRRERKRDERAQLAVPCARGNSRSAPRG